MKKVVIIGAGALGSHAALLLRNEAQLKVIDFDRLETKNVLAQFHMTPHVGKNKAHALQQSMAFLFGVKIESVPHKLTAVNVDQLLAGTDLIVDAVDNGATRRLIQNYARGPLTITPQRPPVPCLHGALAPGGEFGRVCWDETFKIDDEQGAGQPTCEGGEHLPFITMTAAYLAFAAQRFLKDGTKMGFQVHPGGATRV